MQVEIGSMYCVAILIVIIYLVKDLFKKSKPLKVNYFRHTLFLYTYENILLTFFSV